MVHAGLPDAEQGAPFLPGPVFAAPFHLSGDPDERRLRLRPLRQPDLDALRGGARRARGRPRRCCSRPAWRRSPRCCCRACGPATCSWSTVDCYRGVRALAEAHLERRGVEVRARGPAPSSPSALEGARLRLARDARRTRARRLRPRGPGGGAHAAGRADRGRQHARQAARQRPLELGADASMTSATKQLTGHADLMLGYVATRDPERAAGAARLAHAHGLDPGAVRGLARAPLAGHARAARSSAACANALALAELLAARDDVAAVRYPGLPSDPGHEVARRQMRGFGMVVCFDLGSARARRALPRRRPSWSPSATSFGGVHTTAERRARWGGDDVSEGFIRLSAGLRGHGRPAWRTWSRRSTRDAPRNGRQRLPRLASCCAGAPMPSAPTSRARPRLALRSTSATPPRSRGLRAPAPGGGHPHRLPPGRPCDHARGRRRGGARRGDGCGARLVHISTDLVFDGDEGRAPTQRTTSRKPINDYGRAKARRRAGACGRRTPDAARRAHLAALRRRRAGAARSAWPARPGRAAFFRDEVRCPVQVGDLAARAARAGRTRPRRRAPRGRRRRPRSATSSPALLALRTGRDPAAAARRHRASPGPGRGRATARCSIEPRPLACSPRGPGAREVLGRRTPRIGCDGRWVCG